MSRWCDDRKPLTFLSIVLLLLIAAAAPPAALGDSIELGIWNEFSFTSVGVLAQGCYPADPSPTALDCLPSSAGNSVFAPAPFWMFTLDSKGLLTVTDAFLHGDAFDVFNGCCALLFLTPAVAADGNGCGDNPQVCLGDPNASHTIFPLDPGSYSISIFPYAIADAGAAYFRVTQLPEPCEWQLVSLGLAVLSAARWRRRNRL